MSSTYRCLLTMLFHTFIWILVKNFKLIQKNNNNLHIRKGTSTHIIGLFSYYINLLCISYYINVNLNINLKTSWSSFFLVASSHGDVFPTFHPHAPCALIGRPASLFAGMGSCTCRSRDTGFLFFIFYLLRFFPSPLGRYARKIFKC